MKSVTFTKIKTTAIKASKLTQSMQSLFGLNTFRRGQEEIITSVLSGHDTLAVMPTGGGKSLCYQLPAMVQEGITIVISPLISLMRDQVSALQSKNLAAGCIHSGQSLQEKQQVFRDMAASPSYLLYLSPERVQKPGFLSWFAQNNITLIAIDEAHCVSQWGHDFRPDYAHLKLLRTHKPNVPILASTATATPMVLADISQVLNMQNPQRHVYGFYRPNLFYQVEDCESEDHKFAMIKQAITQTPTGRIVIYAGTRKNCEALQEQLSTFVDRTDFYHAGLSTEIRNRIQDDFEHGKIRILIATNAFGMGIDHPDIRLVVHYQIPANIESYYQEMGRAGRDGKTSTCLLLYAKKDKGLQSYFIGQSPAPKSVVNNKWRSLDALIHYCEGAECRHSGILTYFKDQERIETCGHCDVCDPQAFAMIDYQAPQRISKPKRAATQKKVSISSRQMNDTQRARVEKIKIWRKDFAKSQDMPAFLVFSNKTLDDLAVKNPQTIEDLSHVYGLGPHKIEAFGNILLEQLADT